MKRLLTITVFATIGIMPVAAFGGGTPFEFTAPGGAIPDEGIGVFPLFMDATIAEITSIELEINGFAHENPEDLDIYLIDPFGTAIEVMTDLGNGVDVSGLDLIFNDAGASLPGVPITSGTYQTEGLWNTTDLGMATFVGNSGGTDAWILLIIDDDAMKTGSIGSYTLRGTYVPEPMTLSLLAVGAVAVLRRKRK